MKQVIYFCILFCMIFSSCKKNDDDVQGEKALNFNIDNTGYFCDGGQISGISLYCLDVPSKVGYASGLVGSEYYQSVKTIEDYSKFEFLLNIDPKMTNAHSNSYYSQEVLDIIKKKNEYLRNKAKFLYDEYVKDYKKANNGWPLFYTAYTNGEVSITCDKVLFGEMPGSNLSKYFTIKTLANCIIAGNESTQLVFNFGDKLPDSMNEYFNVNKTWLSDRYWLSFATYPSEKYDELTFKVSLPLLIDNVYEYAVSQYNGTNEPMQSEERVLGSECTVTFKW